MGKIGMDDFPHGDKRRYTKENGYVYPQDRKNLTEVLSILESHKISYFLGASPLLFRDGDVEFLNENVKYGEVCMHGFDHGFASLDPWPENLGQWHPIWNAGGEFRNMTENQIEEKYEICKNILLKVNKYNQEDFVLPFDVTTQELINVISRKGIKRLHTCDYCYNGYKLHRFDYYDIEVVIALYQKFYDHVKPIVEKIESGCVNFRKSQIGLHWIFDTKLDRKNWQPYYHRICELINE